MNTNRSSKIIYIGTKGKVSAIDTADGSVIWNNTLKSGLAHGSDYVTLVVVDNFVFAHTYGELFCLDPNTGSMIWSNALDGMGHNIASLATQGVTSTPII